MRFPSFKCRSAPIAWVMDWLLRKIAFSFGLMGIMGALAIVTMQCLSWFEVDTWPDVSLLHAFVILGWRPPTATSANIRRALEIAMRTPMSIIVLVVGLTLRLLVELCASRFARRERST